MHVAGQWLNVQGGYYYEAIMKYLLTAASETVSPFQYDDDPINYWQERTNLATAIGLRHSWDVFVDCIESAHWVKRTDV